MPTAATQSLTNGQYVQPGLTARSAAAAQSIVRAWRLWRRRRRERHLFAHLDERAFNDLALSRWDVERELRKPFWQDCLRSRMSPLQ